MEFQEESENDNSGRPDVSTEKLMNILHTVFMGEDLDRIKKEIKEEEEQEEEEKKKKKRGRKPVELLRTKSGELVPKSRHPDYHYKYFCENRDKICLEIECECGQVYTRNNKNNHLKNRRHIMYLKDKEIKSRERVINDLLKVIKVLQNKTVSQLSAKKRDLIKSIRSMNKMQNYNIESESESEDSDDF